MHRSSKNSFIKFELTVYVHKFNCVGDVLSSNVAGLFRGDDGFMIDNAFSECLLDTNVNGRLLPFIISTPYRITTW